MRQPQETLAARLQRQARNATSLLTSDVLNKATTFVIYALVARNLGAKSFGQLSLGLMLFYLFQVLATAGLPTIVTRAIAQHRKRTVRYCNHGMVTAMLAGIAATGAMIGLTFLLHYDWDTTIVICTLSVGLIPYGIALVIESVFRGCERMHFIAIANLIANAVKVIGSLALFHFGFGVTGITILLVVVRWLILFLDWGLYFLFVRDRRSLVQWRLVQLLFRKSLTFLGIDAVIALWASVDALILSKLATDVEVGLFSAACQLLQPLMLIYKSVVSAIFPSMCSRAAESLERLARVTRFLVAFLALIGFPMIVVLAAFADLILAIAYANKDMEPAIVLLQIVSGVLVFQCITSVLGNALWASSKENVVFRIVVVNLVLSTVFGFVLIAMFGVKGAAISFVLVSAFDAIQHWLAANRLFGSSSVDRWFLVGILSSLLMLAFIVAVGYENRYVGAILGLAVYLTAVGFALYRHHGGLLDLPSRYFTPPTNT